MPTVVNFKTDKKVKVQAQKIAEKMGLNLSDVLNIYLRKFVTGRELHLSLNEDESNPSDELLEAVREAGARGRLVKFKGVDALISHLREL